LTINFDKVKVKKGKATPAARAVNIHQITIIEVDNKILNEDVYAGGVHERVELQ
jgi:hypothetical protein